MKKTLDEIKQALPDIQSEKVEVLASELDRIDALKTMFRSNDGKVLLNRLVSNCSASLTRMRSLMQDKPTLEKLLGQLAIYYANIDLLAEFQDITGEEEIQRQLEEEVKEIARLVG